MIKKLTLFATLMTSSLLFSDSPGPTIVDLKDYTVDRSNLRDRAFNEAPEMGLYLAGLAERFDVDTAFETGTSWGFTTIFLAHHFARVFTVEISKDTFPFSIRNLQPYSNVECHLGSSEKVLHQVLPTLAGKPVLFYLDAHWNEHWPLLEELKEISETHKNNCIIVIDDIKVPGRPDIPYDAYGKDECSYEYIHKELSQVFTEYTCFYLIPKKVPSRSKFVAYPKSWD